MLSLTKTKKVAVIEYVYIEMLYHRLEETKSSILVQSIKEWRIPDYLLFGRKIT